MSKNIDNKTANLLTMAHEVSRTLTILAVKVQSGAELDKGELQTLPGLATYADRVFSEIVPLLQEGEPKEATKHPVPRTQKAQARAATDEEIDGEF